MSNVANSGVDITDSVKVSEGIPSIPRSSYIISIEMSSKILTGNAGRLLALAEAFHNIGNAETGEILRSVATDITTARNITLDAVRKENGRMIALLEGAPLAQDQSLGTDQDDDQ